MRRRGWLYPSPKGLPESFKTCTEKREGGSNNLDGFLISFSALGIKPTAMGGKLA